MDIIRPCVFSTYKKKFFQSKHCETYLEYFLVKAFFAALNKIFCQVQVIARNAFNNVPKIHSF